MWRRTKRKELVQRMRSLEADHEPDGWPAVRMRDISALCDAIEILQQRYDALKQTRRELIFRDHLDLADDRKLYAFRRVG